MKKKPKDQDIQELVTAYSQLPKSYREQAKIFLFYLQCVALQKKSLVGSVKGKPLSLAKVKKMFADKQASEIADMTHQDILDEIRDYRYPRIS